MTFFANKQFYISLYSSHYSSSTIYLFTIIIYILFISCNNRRSINYNGCINRRINDRHIALQSSEITCDAMIFFFFLFSSFFFFTRDHFFFLSFFYLVYFILVEITLLPLSIFLFHE